MDLSLLDGFQRSRRASGSQQNLRRGTVADAYIGPKPHSEVALVNFNPNGAGRTVRRDQRNLHAILSFQKLGLPRLAFIFGQVWIADPPKIEKLEFHIVTPAR